MSNLGPIENSSAINILNSIDHPGDINFQGKFLGSGVNVCFNIIIEIEPFYKFYFLLLFMQSLLSIKVSKNTLQLKNTLPCGIPSFQSTSIDAKAIRYHLKLSGPRKDYFLMTSPRNFPIEPENHHSLPSTINQLRASYSRIFTEKNTLKVMSYTFAIFSVSHYAEIEINNKDLLLQIYYEQRVNSFLYINSFIATTCILFVF